MNAVYFSSIKRYKKQRDSEGRCQRRFYLDILSDIPKVTEADETRACQYLKAIKLKTNMRDVLSNYRISEEFLQRLVSLGEGGITVCNERCLK